MYLIGMLVLLFLANIAMLMGLTNWPARVREGFAQAVVKGKVGGKVWGRASIGTEGFAAAQRGSGMLPGMEGFAVMKKGSGMEGFMDARKSAGSGSGAPEAFMDYLSNGFATAPIGSYDGVNLAAGLPAAAQGFRANHPNVPLAGPPVEIGPDNLFYFKNNTVGPQCCSATLSSDGGCVCTSPQDRDFINQRGGNRKHDDGF